MIAFCGRGFPGVGLLKPLGQLGGIAGFVQIPHRHRIRGRIFPQQRDHHGRTQGIAAQLGKEIVMDGKVTTAGEDLFEGAEDAALHGVSGEHPRPFLVPGLLFEEGQALAVQLPSHRDRQLRQDAPAAGHHVGGEHPLQFGLEGLEGRRSLEVLGHDEGHQGLCGAFSLHSAGGLPHAFAIGEARLDGLELDAVAPQLDLGIDAPVEDEGAVRLPLHEVARAIDPPEFGVFGKFLGGEFGPLPVAPCEADASHAELPQFPVRQLVQGRIQGPGQVPGNGAADGDGAFFQDVRPQAGDGAFGGSVAVDQSASSRPAVRHIPGQRLPAHVEEAKFRQGDLGVLAARGAQEGRRGAEHGDVLVAQPGDEVRAQPGGLVVHHHHRGAHGPGQPGLFQGGIVGGRGALRHSVLWAESEFLQIRGHEVGDAAVLDHHTLGASRRTGGVDEVGKALGAQPGGRGRCIRRGQRGCVEGSFGVEAEGLSPGLALGVRQDSHGLRIFENVAQLRIGEGRIDAGVGGARAKHRKLGGIEVFG